MHRLPVHFSARSSASLRNKLFTAALLIALGSISHSQDATSKAAPTQNAGPVSEVITEQALRDKMDAAIKAKAQKGPIGKPVDPPQSLAEDSLASRFLILGDGSHFTFLPLGAILHLPPDHRSKLIEQPSGTFLSWPNFLKKNTSWLAGRDVTMKMASGQDPKLTQRVIRELSAETRAVVALLGGNPVSMLEPESPKTERDIGRSTTESSRLDRNSLSPRQ